MLEVAREGNRGMSGFDLLIRGARVLDPGQGLDLVTDIAVRNGKIFGIGNFSSATAARVIDATGLIASPGWVDLHVHVFNGAVVNAVDPDRDAGVARGVTTVVDAGSAGALTWEQAREEVIKRATTRVLGYLNVSISRAEDRPWHGDWQVFDQNKTIAMAEQEAAAGYCVGIKVLSSQRHVGNLGIIPLKLAGQAARYSGMGLMVHLGVAPPVIEDVLNLLDEGDIVTHCWHGKGQGILGPDNKPLPETWAAVERGVRWDIGHGLSSFAFDTARHAMAAGLPLDSISTDLHGRNVNGPVYDMATTMAKFLHLGFSLPDVIRLSTVRPAQLIGRSHEFGTLRPDSCADITIFRVIDGDFTFTDANGESVKARQHLEVHYTVRAGQVVKEP